MVTASPTARARVDCARFRAVLWFEVQAQAREPLTALYLLVFGLLALGYASSNTVELVSDRGTVPRTAPWSLMLAFGGLTAFGQVITTMIATTAMLRDEAQRTRALVATSGLGPRTWFAARVSAALLVMGAVYAAMPAGILLGTVIGRGDLAAAMAGGVRAYAMLTIPTVITVTVLLASAALVTRRVLGVLAVALALVGLWQLSLALVARDGTVVVGALLDPFGNAPVLAVTQGWSAWQKASQHVPLASLVAVNRGLWGLVSLLTLGLVLWRWAPQAFREPPTRHPAGRRAAAAPALAACTSALASLRRFTALWLRRDGGWRVVGCLAVLNALANAVSRPLAVSDGHLTATTSALLLVSEHARLFLILLATVYAGELVWRDRDVRVHDLVDSMPVARRTLVWGRVQGLLLAQWSVVLPLALAALVSALWRAGMPGGGAHGTWPSTGAVWLAWSAFVLWLPFVQLTVLSLTVHVLLDHKVAAHLLLITGWVVAVVLDGQGVAAWWMRFAEAAPLLRGDAVAWGPLAQRGAYWTAVSAALLMVCWWRWPSRATARRC